MQFGNYCENETPTLSFMIQAGTVYLSFCAYRNFSLCCTETITTTFSGYLQLYYCGKL